MCFGAGTGSGGLFRSRTNQTSPSTAETQAAALRSYQQNMLQTAGTGGDPIGRLTGGESANSNDAAPMVAIRRLMGA